LEVAEIDEVTEIDENEEYQEIQQVIEPDPAPEVEEHHEEMEEEIQTTDEDNHEQVEKESDGSLRRSKRTVQPPSRYSAMQLEDDEQKYVICHQTNRDDERYYEYEEDIVVVAARTIESLNHEVSQKGATFSQQYILKKGIKKFGKKGEKAAAEELDQPQRRNCFNPIDVSTLTPSKKKAMESLLFLTEKRDGRIKGRLVYNGKPTRKWLSKEEATSPTASLEGIFLTAINDAKEAKETKEKPIL
jgi:hypothetical protein